MGLGRIVPAVLAGLAILGFALLSHSAQGQDRVNGFAERLLAAHNAERVRIG